MHAKSEVGSRIKVSYKIGQRDKDGNLIVMEGTRGRWWLYFFGEWDRKRTLYCMKHRRDILPKGFREGVLNLSTLLFTLKIRGEWNGL